MKSDVEGRPDQLRKDQNSFKIFLGVMILTFLLFFPSDMVFKAF